MTTVYIILGILVYILIAGIFYSFFLNTVGVYFETDAVWTGVFWPIVLPILLLYLMLIPIKMVIKWIGRKTAPFFRRLKLPDV